MRRWMSQYAGWRRSGWRAPPSWTLCVLADLDPKIRSRAEALAGQFQAAIPFRNVVADDFLTEEFAQALLDEFPAFERGHALNEAGEIGGKSVVERIRSLGNSYRRLDALVRSNEFLQLIGRITGIPDLLYDPHYVGGGTH